MFGPVPGLFVGQVEHWRPALSHFQLSGHWISWPVGSRRVVRIRRPDTFSIIVVRGGLFGVDLAFRR
jgi:hypothetical protein